MEEKISFFKKVKNNNYVRSLILSIGAIVLSYGVIFIFILIEHYFNLEILLYVLLFIIFIIVSNLLQKKYTKNGKLKVKLLIPGLFLILMMLPGLEELDDINYGVDNNTYVNPGNNFNYPNNDTNFEPGQMSVDKPIIYLYPETKQEIDVTLEVEGKIIADYPKYNEEIKGWNVTAYPDGKIIENGKEYSYIFWEAEFENNNWDLSTGFIVEGKDAREFLEEKLSYMGLTPKEYNEFIVYWYPIMMNNTYNLIYFAGDDYDQRAPLEITPTPDSMLRVFMVIKPLEEKIEITEQKLEKFDRKGFSVIEWGGTVLD